MNGKGWHVAIFLAGLLVGGLAGVIRGDWLGGDAAQAVESRLKERVERIEERIHDDIKEIKEDLKRLLER